MIIGTYLYFTRRKELNQQPDQINHSNRELTNSQAPTQGNTIMASLSGQHDAGSDMSAPAPGANQTGESLGDHGKTAETQSSMVSLPTSVV